MILYQYYVRLIKRLSKIHIIFGRMAFLDAKAEPVPPCTSQRQLPFDLACDNYITYCNIGTYSRV